MKFCPNCGTQIDDNATFCGNCGTSMVSGLQAENATAPAPQGQELYQAAGELTSASGMGSYGTGAYGTGAQPPKKSKKPLIIAAIAAVCIVAAIAIFFAVRAFTGGGSTKADEKDFIGIQLAYFEERFANVSALSKGGSFSSDITVSGTFESTDPDLQKINQILDGSAVIFKLDAKKNDFLSNIILNLQGSNVLEADLTLTDKEFGFAVPAADGNYYVGDFKTMMQTLGAGEKEIEALMNSIEMMGGLDSQVFADAYKKILNAGINDRCLTITKKATVELDKIGESAEGTLYVWQPTKEDCKAIMDQLADELETGAALGAYLKMLEQMDGSFSSGGTQFETAEEMIQNFRSNADTYAQEMFDSGFKWEMATNKSGQVVMSQISASDVQIGYQGSVTDQKVKEHFFISQYGNTQVRIDHEANVSGKQWTGTVSFGTPAGALPITYDLDTSKYSALGMPYGNVSLSLASLGLNVTMEITTQAGDSSSSDMTVKLTGLSPLTEGTLESMEITVNTTDKSSAVKPSGSKVDVSNYTEEDYNELLQSMMTGIGLSLLGSPVLRELMTLFY